MYKEWADGQINKMKGILNSAREGHTSAVKSRIENVKQLGGVVEVTKQLFEVSKVYIHQLRMVVDYHEEHALIRVQETAKIEAEVFQLEQKTALAAEAKSVLDSWVRYEGQVKQRQQKELAESIIGKITKELENPKTLQQILNQSVADVESKDCFNEYHYGHADHHYRDRFAKDRDHFAKGAIDVPSLVQNIETFPV